MIKKYLDYQLYTRGLSVETIERYKKTLTYFEKFLQGI
jgi:site-specific recombinase XerD